MYIKRVEYIIGTNLKISSNLDSVALVLYRLAKKKITDQINWTIKIIDIALKNESLTKAE